MTTLSDTDDLLSQLRRPRTIKPRVRPVLGLLLWFLTVAVVMVSGQAFFPQALVEHPGAQRDAGYMIVSGGIGLVLIVIHVVYWRRLRRHLAASRRLQRDLSDRFRMALTVQSQHAAGISLPASWWSFAVPVGTGILTAVLTVAIISPALSSLLDASGNVDSPMLALVFLAIGILPFGIAMTAVGFSRAQLAGLRVQLAGISG